MNLAYEQCLKPRIYADSYRLSYISISSINSHIYTQSALCGTDVVFSNMYTKISYCVSSSRPPGLGFSNRGVAYIRNDADMNSANLYLKIST